MNVDLRTEYLGLELRNPLVASASPLSGSLGALRALEDAGVGAVVMQSLFEEQIEYEDQEVHRVLETGAESFPEALNYFPELEEYNTGPSAYLRHLEEAKAAVSIPVIGSLNGVSKGGWIRYARLMEDAGVDALELNVYLVAADPDIQPDEVEAQYLDLVAGVRAEISIPLAVKVGPFFTAMANVARRIVDAGADGLVLFNRFLHPDIDLESLQVVPSVHLSSSKELGLPLRWIALLRGRVEASLAATTGLHTAEDMLKLLLVGADVTMTASALLQRGPDQAGQILRGVAEWLAERDYRSVQQMKGSLSQIAAPDPSAFERTQYMKALVDYSSSYEFTGREPS